MKEFVKNMKYWGYTLETISLGMILVALIVVAFMTVIEGGDFFHTFFEQVPYFLMMMMGIGSFVNVINGINIYLPLTVSLGSTRKDSFIGMQLTQHLIMVQNLILFCLLISIGSKDLFRLISLFMPTVIGICLFLIAMGNVIGAFYMRFGRIVGMILYVVIMIVMVGFFVVMGVSYELGELNIGMSLGDFLFGPYILLAGILLDALVITWFYLTLRKQNLQFS